MTPRRLVAAVACLALAPLALSVEQGSAAATTPTTTSAPTSGATSGSARRSLLRPADGVPRATIEVTRHGIPHIIARDYESLGFGQGYVAAQSSGCTLLDTLLTARGWRSRVFGPKARYNDQVTLDATNLQVDALMTDIHNRRVVEKLLADPKRGPGAQTKALVRGYVGGINKYLAKIGGIRHYSDPKCNRWRGADIKARPLDLWYGVYVANLLASTGVFVPQIVDATPPTPGDPGLPTASPVPTRAQLLSSLGRDPAKPFGSNATAVGGDVTTTGKGMVLGNPHFPWNGRYRFTESHLTIPGHYDVAGASLVGSPVINIGWNRDVAWSHTVSTAYRFTPYEYKLVSGQPTTYLTTEGPRDLVRRTVAVVAKRPDGSRHTLHEDLYRTDEGYVLDDADVLMPWTSESVFALRDANAEHLRTVDTFHFMAKAHTVRGLLAAQDRGAGMPWVNTTAADRNGDVLYADHSVVPNVPDDLVDSCITPNGVIVRQLAGLPILDGTRAAGECRWRTDPDASRPGVFGPSNLPKEVRRDWVMNANDSYWLPNPKQPLEGYAGIIGCERCERSLRTRMVDRYVLDRLAGRDGLARRHKVSPRTLRATEHVNRVMGGELAKEHGDLTTVCQTAGGGNACAALARWDGTSNKSAIGYQVFEEFWKRAESVPGLWQTPFDATHPVNTPRDLNEANPQVVQAMSDAIAYLRQKKVPMKARWGSLHVAGDRGAPAIPLGGGSGFSGNANALKSDLRKGKWRVTYGSSHIQAIAFRAGGRVDAHTILTYGQFIDPTRRTSSDQTRMFGHKRWVHFPWTRTQIRRQLVTRFTIHG